MNVRLSRDSWGRKTIYSMAWHTPDTSRLRRKLSKQLSPLVIEYPGTYLPFSASGRLRRPEIEGRKLHEGHITPRERRRLHSPAGCKVVSYLHIFFELVGGSRHLRWLLFTFRTAHHCEKACCLCFRERHHPEYYKAKHSTARSSTQI